MVRSEIARYLNHHANSTYVSLLALLFLFLSSYPSTFTANKLPVQVGWSNPDMVTSHNLCYMRSMGVK